MPRLYDLFPESPFTHMIAHIDKVSLCLDQLEILFDSIRNKEYEKLDPITNEIVRLEEEADQIKILIRKEVAKNLFLPVDKKELLSILSAQDDISDISEDIAKLFSLRKMEIPEGLVGDYQILVDAILKAARDGVKTIKELSNLFEVGFKGPEVQKVVNIINELEESEKMADKEGLEFTRKILALEGVESPVAIYMWMRIIKVMGDLANVSQKLSKKFRLLLD